MKNFYDGWNVIFDSQNKPLLGKIEFYEYNTTSLKTIYDADGNQLTNPIYVNGRPDTQIMLDNSDYTVRFYEYIGHGDMRHDEEYGHWFNYKTEYIKDNTVVADNTMEMASVVTINDLKNLKNMEDGDVIQVLGYYKKDDCPVRYYVWHATGNNPDDGGITIKSNNSSQGYWLMKIPGTYVDVRWYGDIPSNFSSASTSNESQRVKAANAANYFHKDLYFPSYEHGNALGFYMFNGSNTVTVSKDIICDNGVRFVVKAGTQGTKIQCHEFYKCDKYLFISVNDSTAIGGYSLECNWIRTSWLGKDRATDTNARVGYIIDYLNTPLILKDTRVKFERDGLNKTGCTFTGCLFEDCHKNIDKQCTFNNMEIKQSWFADDFDFVSNCSFFGCTMKLDNFNDADTYIRMKNKQNEHDYGDLNEAILNNATILTGTLSDPAILENCGGSIVLSSGQGYVELHNASVAISGVTSTTNLNMVDCWMSLTGNNLVCESIALRRGSISGTKVQVLNNVYMENADINCELYIPGATNQFNSCNIRAKITSVNLKLNSCSVYSVVESWPQNKSFRFELIGNKFIGEGAYHHLTTNLDVTAEHDTTVDGVWTSNTANYNTQHWVHVRHYGVAYSGHTYVYTNNGNPYFDRMNARPITFYGVTMYVEIGETARKDRIRTDIPLIVINTADTRVRLANFKTYGFSISKGLAAQRVKMFCDNAMENVSGGSYVPNAVILNCRYALPATLLPNQEYFNWEFTSYDISSGTGDGEKFKEGSDMGWTNNNNLNIYTHNLSVWQQDSSSDNKPMARKTITFEIIQDANVNYELDPGIVE